MGDTRSSRQRPGQACLSCRSKKLKCDGVQPQCGNCVLNGMNCVIPLTSAKRGPPKGHMKAMQSRLATLEQRLLALDNANLNVTTEPKQEVLSIDPADISLDTSLSTSGSGGPTTMPMTTATATAPMASMAPPNFSGTLTPSDDSNSLYDASLHGVFDSCPAPDKTMLDVDFSHHATDALFQLPSPPNSSQLSFAMPCGSYPFPSNLDTLQDPILGDLLLIDLEQLYFERVHPIAPILHRRRYFSWARSPSKTPAQMCLQYAICLSAASLSVQLDSIRHSLYDHIMHLLSSIECTEPVDVSTEHLQARLLVLLYDFMRSSQERGWISAGKCFRLIQLARLFATDSAVGRQRELSSRHRSSSAGKSDSISIDDNGNFTTTDDNAQQSDYDWIAKEEKRRIFWTAFCLDIFISIAQSWPLSLHEHTDGTRLPMPEHKFQQNEYVEMEYLGQDLDTAVDHVTLSPLHESIKCAAVYRQFVLHQQQYGASNAKAIGTQAFWAQHEQIDTIVRSRAQSQQALRGQLEMNPDPMLIIAHMVLNMTALGLMEVIECGGWQTAELEAAGSSYRQRAMSAATDIFDLSRLLSGLSHLKAHPFTPVLLIACADFFSHNKHLDLTYERRAAELDRTLRDMSLVNNMASHGPGSTPGSAGGPLPLWDPRGS